MIFGTTNIDGHYWLVMLPLGGKHRKDVPGSQFNKLLELAGKENFHTEMATLCEELSREERYDDDGYWIAFGRVSRYDEQECNWDLERERHRSLALGFRPVLVPLKKAAGLPDCFYMDSFEDGEIIEMGTLYMDNQPLKNPKSPVYCEESVPSWTPPKNGDCPRYVKGAQLRIGNTSPNEDERIRLIKAGNCFVADRVLLGCVSYEDLALNLQLKVYRGPKSLVAGYYEPRKDARTIASGRGGLF